MSETFRTFAYNTTSSSSTILILFDHASELVKRGRKHGERLGRFFTFHSSLIEGPIDGQSRKTIEFPLKTHRWEFKKIRVEIKYII